MFLDAKKKAQNRLTDDPPRYTIGQVPCNIALYYIKPRYFFPACMVLLRPQLHQRFN